MTKVSEEQPQDTFSLFLRHMSTVIIRYELAARDSRQVCSEKRKVEPLRVRPFSKMHEMRLFFGFSEESV